MALGTDRLEAAAAYLGRGASRFWGPSFLPFCIHLGQFVLGKGSKVCVPSCSVHFSELLFVRVLQVSKLEKANAIPLGKLSLKKSLDFAKYFMMVRSGGISDFT